MPDTFSQRLDVHDLFVRNEFSAVTYQAKLPDKRLLVGTLDPHGRSPQIYAKADEKIELLVGQTLGEWDLLVDYDNVDD